MHDGAREEGIDGRGDVGLDEEEEDLLVRDREQGRADDRRLRVRPDLDTRALVGERARREGNVVRIARD